METILTIKGVRMIVQVISHSSPVQQLTKPLFASLYVETDIESLPKKHVTMVILDVTAPVVAQSKAGTVQILVIPQLACKYAGMDF